MLIRISQQLLALDSVHGHIGICCAGEGRLGLGGRLEPGLRKDWFLPCVSKRSRKLYWRGEFMVMSFVCSQYSDGCGQRCSQINWRVCISLEAISS